VDLSSAVFMIDMARYKVEIEEKFVFLKSTGWNSGYIGNIASINMFQCLSKGNFDKEKGGFHWK